MIRARCIWLNIPLVTGMASAMERSSPKNFFHIFRVVHFLVTGKKARIFSSVSMRWEGRCIVCVVVLTSHPMITFMVSQKQSPLSSFYWYMPIPCCCALSCTALNTRSMEWKRTRLLGITQLSRPQIRLTLGGAWDFVTGGQGCGLDGCWVICKLGRMVALDLTWSPSWRHSHWGGVGLVVCLSG